MQLQLLTDYITEAMRINAVQLYFSVSCPVSYKDGNGCLIPLDGEILLLTPEHVKALVEQAVKEQKDRETLRDYGEVETYLSSYGRMRSRVNAFIQRGTYAMTVTILTSNKEQKIVPVEQWGLDLEPILNKPTGGLCVITGHQNTGGLAASLVNHFNTSHMCHIVTLEDSVSALHRHNLAMVNQRDLPGDTSACHETIKRVKNLGADVCLISSVKNEELFVDMLELAMSGVFVIGVFVKSSLLVLVKSLASGVEAHDLQERAQKLRKCLKLCVDLDSSRTVKPEDAFKWLSVNYDC